MNNNEAAYENARVKHVKEVLPKHFQHKNPLTDTAGIPWSIRDYHESQFPNDDGGIILAVAKALERYDRGEDPLKENLVSKLRGTRVLIPIQAIALETSQDHLKADNASQMSMVKLKYSTEIAMPIFSSTSSLAHWNQAARPVPMIIEQAAQSAVMEECTQMWLDLGRPNPVVITRSMLWAIAQDRHWIHPAKDPEVFDAFEDIAKSISEIKKIAITPGNSAEIEIHLKLIPGLDSEAVSQVVSKYNQAIAYQNVIAHRVSSIKLRLHQ